MEGKAANQHRLTAESNMNYKQVANVTNMWRNHNFARNLNWFFTLGSCWILTPAYDSVYRKICDIFLI